MIDQIKFVEARDGTEFAVAYARQALKAYRQATRIRGVKGRHFCHDKTFREHYVRAIIEIRQFLREQKDAI